MQEMTWRTLLRDTKPFRKRITLGQLVAVLAVAISLPVPLLFPLLVDQVLLEKPAQLTGLIDLLFAPEHPWGYIVVVLLTTLFLRMLFVVANVFQSRLFTIISKHLVFTIRRRILEHLRHVSVSEYEALGGGGVSARLVTDIDTVDAFIGVSIGRFFVSALSLIGVALVLLFINWQLALIILLLNPAVVALTTWLGKKVRRLKRTENQRIERFQNRLSETLDLFVQIRTYNQEQRYIDSMIDDARSIRDASTQYGWKSEAAGQLSSLLFLSGFEFFRASSMLMVLFSSLSIGEMFAVLGYLWFMVTPLQDMLQIIFSYQNATAALERLNALLRLEKEPKYPHEQNPFEGRATNAISVEHLSFGYGKKRVLHDISMQIHAGKTVALLGHSGSGKTTLAQLVLGLYAPQEGSICIDDVPVEQIGLDVIRDHVALVLQTPKMFNDTLRQNLTLGRDLPDDKLYDVLHVAQLDDVVSKLTEGLETMIGKDGIRLSGGERQRLSIARMLLHAPSVVILDESTSALDVQTESHLFTSLRDYLKGKTTLIIAHRLSTVEHADYVYFLDDGRIVEAGTPEELLRREGFYQRFVQKQLVH
ncbi:ABC transporter ATP-binding protein/permease [Sulfurimonas sp. HSL-3221]|uniref:ABC transporter ATP-binding protein n=1 Tax=Thiomicrolovo sulfuroxydans TaxID=2894755 RepID=UPI001E374BFC|nr:ABC transporter ATP-binding protein [Sulfurimonas sp. HSL-3221]UFS61431.1 ABC transporter ATP-binding protein/permease [Sulfurimonas sp. HSL-3221]